MIGSGNASDSGWGILTRPMAVKSTITDAHEASKTRRACCTRLWTTPQERGCL